MIVQLYSKYESFGVPKQQFPQFLTAHCTDMTMQPAVKLLTDKYLIKGYQRSTDICYHHTCIWLYYFLFVEKRHF